MKSRHNQASQGRSRLQGAIGLMLALLHSAALAAPAEPKARPPAERSDSGPNCTGEAARPGNMTLLMGKSTLMRLPEPVRHRSMGNAAVAQAMLVSPDTLYLVGVDVGTTNMIIQGRSGACSMVDIQVVLDPAAIQAVLALALPDEKNIKVSSANEKVVLTGTVSDAFTSERAAQLAGAFLTEKSRSLGRMDKDAGSRAPGGSPSDEASRGRADQVINMLTITAPQQVMLEVKIAEVSKSLLETLEGGTLARFGSGSWAGTLLANFLSPSPPGALSVDKTNGNRLQLNANKTDGLVRILAEPNVMAVSGQEGSFLAGGKIFIPVAQENNKVSLEEKEFGVGLRFTPTVLAGGRINLKVAPEVSEVSREGIGVSALGFTGAAVLPLITTRRSSTTVQLYDGQSFAIGGLIKNNFVSNMKGLPLLGEVPILGALFRSSDYQHDRTELVFVVTVHLVKPLPPDYSLPTDKVKIPTRAELLLGGRQEGAQNSAVPVASATARGFELK